VAASDVQSEDSRATAARVALRVAAGDLMVFAGVDPEQVRGVTQEGRGDIDLPTPPEKPEPPFGALRRR